MRRLRSVVAGAVAAAVCAAGAVLYAAEAAPKPRSHSGTSPSGATWVADVPKTWNGTVVLFSRGYGELVARNAPDDETKRMLLAAGYALVGSSYSGPSLWALESAVDDQFAALTALEQRIGRARRTIAWGVSMGGLVSALEAQDPRGRIDGALTTCGMVAGALNLNNRQLDGEYALARLLLPGERVRLVRHRDEEQARATAEALQDATAKAQRTPKGRARIALAAALLNIPAWSPDRESPPAPGDHAAQQEHQYRILMDGRIPLFIDARRQIELAAGGNSSANAGVDYRALLDGGAMSGQVRRLYRAAGLDLDRDLAALTRDADVEADPQAVRSLTRTSMATGALSVPVLNVHNVADPVVPVQEQHWYAEKVARAGDSRLLRQAYVRGSGHCEFRPQETVAALHALEHRLEVGRWHDAATPRRLNAAVTGLGGTPRYVPFAPPSLVGALDGPGRR